MKDSIINAIVRHNLVPGKFKGVEAAKELGCVESEEGLNNRTSGSQPLIDLGRYYKYLEQNKGIFGRIEPNGVVKVLVVENNKPKVVSLLGSPLFDMFQSHG